jgi:hypothetical protein
MDLKKKSLSSSMVALSDNEFYLQQHYCLPDMNNNNNNNRIDHLHSTKSSVGVLEGLSDDSTPCCTLRVVFDGRNRFACSFKVDAESISKSKAAATTAAAVPDATTNQNKRHKKCHAVSVQDDAILESTPWSKEYLIPHMDSVVEHDDAAIDDAAATATDALKLMKSLAINDASSVPHSSSSSSSFSSSVLVALDDISRYPDALPVPLTSCTVIPRDEDTDLVRAIRSDLKAYDLLIDATTRRLEVLQKSSRLVDLSATTLRRNQEASLIEHKYLRQQVWKHISMSLVRGVRDQTPGFNKTEQEAIPASWSVAVEGRPMMQDKDKADDDAEGEQHEDAICMCCFDGTSVEGNRIMFCDGCNAALHQVCYGVKHIPEGDFFCDRCVYIKLLAKESQLSSQQVHVSGEDLPAATASVATGGGIRAATAAMCCLCPLQHGGLKPTTDGRWVHLCCTLWSKDSIITDLSDMGPVDVSRVPVQLPGEGVSTTENSSRSRDRRVFLSSKLREEEELFVASFNKHCTLSTIQQPCVYCKLTGGYLSSCPCADAVDGPSSSSSSLLKSCSKVFHPLCAWFEGAYMKATITDESYQGLQRDGLLQYPSGIHFDFHCLEHSSSSSSGASDSSSSQRCSGRFAQITDEQRALRSKYRINEDDLDQIPGGGSNKRRRKKSKRRERTSVSRAMGASSSSSSSSSAKDLNIDVYDPQYCAACLEPISCDPFQCGYDFNARPPWENNEYVIELMSKVPISNASNGLITSSSASNGLITSSSASNGLIFSSSASNGLITSSSASNGLITSSSASNELITTSSASNGLITSSSASNGLITSSSASNGLIASSNASNELITASSASNGLITSSSASNGLITSSDFHQKITMANKIDESGIFDNSNIGSFLFDLSNSGAHVKLPNGATATNLNVAATLGHSSSSEDAQRLSDEFNTGPNYFACCQCGLRIHKSCSVGSHPVDEAVWHCEMCREPAHNRGALQASQVIHTASSSSSSGQKHYESSSMVMISQVQMKPLNESVDATGAADLRCCLCPRRGGYFRRTTDHKWAHPYCASMVPGNIKLTREGLIDIRFVPKESRKEKCFVCNRKNGVCRPCSFVGCPVQFHPICGARSGKAFMWSRLGERIAFCCNHIPESAEKLPSGHWIDGYELERFRYSLDRARLIIDILVRREKYKKMLCKAETELLSLRFHKLLDKAKRRKHKGAGDSYIDLSDLELNESDDDVLSDDDDDFLYQHLDVTNFIPIIACPMPSSSSSSAITATSSTGRSVSVSARWVKRNEVRLPRKVFITFAGLEVERKDINREGGNRMFSKHFRDILSRNSNAMRKVTQIFSSETEELEFGRLLGLKLRKHLNMGLDELMAHLHRTPLSSSDNPSKGASSRRMKGMGATLEDSPRRGSRGRPKKANFDWDQPDAPLDLVDSPELTIQSSRRRRSSEVARDASSSAVVVSELPTIPLVRTGRNSRSSRAGGLVVETQADYVVNRTTPSSDKGSSRKRALEVVEVTAEVVPSSRPRRRINSKHVTFSDSVDSTSFIIEETIVVESSSSSSSRSRRNMSVESTAAAVGGSGRSTRSSPSPEEPLDEVVVGNKKRSRTAEVPVEEDVVEEEEDDDDVADDDDDDDDDDVESDDMEAMVTVDEPFEGDISEYFMANNETAADTVLESSPWRHMTRTQLLEKLLSDDLLSEMMMLDDQSGEGEEGTPRSGRSAGQQLNGFDRCFRRAKIDRITRSSRELRSGSQLEGVSNADEWKIYGQRELFRLERRLQVRPFLSSFL